MQNYEDILRKLKDSGLKLTPFRKALIKALLSVPAPLSEADLRAKLSLGKRIPDKTTVYRQIETLKSLGIVAELDFGEGLKRYEIAKGHHHHLICNNCNTVEEIKLKNDLKAEEGRIKSQKHFTVDSHMLEFFGLCQKCSAR